MASGARCIVQLDVFLYEDKLFCILLGVVLLLLISEDIQLSFKQEWTISHLYFPAFLIK
jgi:hypothetical protein